MARGLSCCVLSVIVVFVEGGAAQSQNLRADSRSPQVSAERMVTFRIGAPKAEVVRLSASDIPGMDQPRPLTKADDGTWAITVGPLEPGAYRYKFNIDGVPTLDPRNPEISEAKSTTWSLVHVPGSELWDIRDVAHGAMAEVTYKSSTFGTFARMHVYTPPGYDKGSQSYPVLYLFHGGTENDDTWTSVGRAGFILDNLLAARKAKPMIVVMPTGQSAENAGQGRKSQEAFAANFNRDVMPYVEANYRVLTDRSNTAIAGASIGGNHTLNIAIPRLERFGYIGLFSSGLIGAFRDLSGASDGPGPDSRLLAREWEQLHAAKLGNAALKRDLRLLWVATGKDDFILDTTLATVELLKKHGFAPVFKEAAGGHTWMNWRSYLAEFVPQLFPN